MFYNDTSTSKVHFALFFWFIVVENRTVPAQVVQAWTTVREIVTECFQRHHVNPNQGSRHFISCIGILTKNAQALLEGHPDQWDNSKKGGFLMESYAYSQQVSGRINKSELRWPVEAGGGTPWLLSELILRGREKKVIYDKDFPNDYVKLCRHSYKHFNKLPNYIKVRDLNCIHVSVPLYSFKLKYLQC